MNKKSKIINATAALVFIILIILIIFTINTNLYEIVKSKTITNLNNLGDIQNQLLSEQIKRKTNQLHSLASFLETPQNKYMYTTLKKMKQGTDKASFSSIFVTDSNGLSKNIYGAKDIAFDFKNSNNYKMALKNQTSVCQIEKTNINDTTKLIITVPVKNNKSVSAIHGICNFVNVDELYDLHTYQDEIYSIVITPTGELISNYNYTNKLSENKNILTFLNQVKYKNNMSYEDILKSIKNKDSISFEFEYEGNYRLVSLMPSSINNWVLLTLATTNEIQPDMQTTIKLILSIFFILSFIFLLTIIYIYLQRKKSILVIQNSYTRFQNLIDNIQGGVIICHFNHEDKTLKIEYMSDGWTTLTGYTLQEMKDNYNENPQALILPEDREATNQSYIEQMKKGNNYRLQYRLRHKNGNFIWIIDKGIITPDPSGKFSENQSIMTDITDIKKQEETIKLNEERFRISILTSNMCVYDFDLTTNKFIHFENAEKIFGFTNDVAIKKFNDNFNKENNSFNDILHPGDIDIYLQSERNLLANGFSDCELRYKKFDDSYIWCFVHKELILDNYGRAIRTIVNISNIDASKKKNEQLTIQVQTEPLTGLLNKVTARSRIDDILKTNGNLLHALMVIDIDDFKSINDTMGHTFGDTVLIDVSKKLKKLFRSQDVVARIGGDEFLVFAENIPSYEIAIKKAQSICDAFRYTYLGKKENYKISCSVGVVFSDKNSSYETFDEMFLASDVSMYDAKNKGKDQFSIYDPTKEYNQTKNKRINDNDKNIDTSKLTLSERIFELLYGTTDFIGSVNMILAFLGQYSNSSRVYVFEMSKDMSKIVNTFEWYNIDLVKPLAEDLKTFEILSALDYTNLYNADGIFNNYNIDTLPEQYYNLIKEQELKSFIQVAIMEDSLVKGFIGFDFNYESNELNDTVYKSLIFAAKILGTFILKRRAEEKNIETSKNKVDAIDNLSTAVYVIDDDYNIHYYNYYIYNLIPKVELGDKCYKAFMNLDKPCENCPTKVCGDDVSFSHVRNSINMLLFVTACKIKWSNQDMFLLSCQDVAQYFKETGLDFDEFIDRDIK